MNLKLKSLLSIALITLLSGCSIFPKGDKLDWAKLKNTGTGISLASENFQDYDLDFDASAFHKAMDKADSIAVSKGNVYTFNSEMSKVQKYMASLRGKLAVSRTKYYASGSSNDKMVYDDIYDEYLGFYTWYYPFLLHVVSSSEMIYESFFGDMSKAEVKEYVESFKYDESTKEMDTEIEEIQNAQEVRYNEFVQKFSAGIIKVGDEAYNQYMFDSLSSFREIVSVGNEYAEYKGYDNYLDLVYDSYYNRDYSYNFVEGYGYFINDYVLPMIKYYNDNVDKSILNIASKKDVYNRYFNSNISDMYCYQGAALDSYVNLMGGDMLNTYNHLKEDGLFCFSNSSSSLGTAYVSAYSNEPVIYFSKNYQDVSTIVHEFGHYNAFYTNENVSSFPLDIQETHSQANEMLFNKYLATYYKGDVNEDIYHFIMDSQVNDMLRSTAFTYATAEVETYAFNNLDKSNEVLLANILKMMEKYDGIIYSAYWATPIVSSTGYYISYTTSGAASLAVYVQANEDFDKARANYLKFVGYPYESRNISTIFAYSGLYSPLDVSTFKKFTPSSLFSF